MTIARTAFNKTLLVGIGVIAALAVLVAIVSWSPSDSSAVATPTALSKVDAIDATAALRLSAAPNIAFGREKPNPGYSSAADLKRVGAAIEKSVPFPPGHPSDVDWDAAAAQGGDDIAGMTSVVQFNAACKWLQADLDSGGLGNDNANRVLATLQSWPSVRSTFKAEWIKKTLADINAGNSESAKASIASNCA